MSNTTARIRCVALIGVIAGLLATPIYLSILIKLYGGKELFLEMARVVFTTLIVTVVVCSSTTLFWPTKARIAESDISRISPRASALFSAILVSICLFIVLGALGASPSVAWVIVMFSSVAAFSAGIWSNRTP